MFPLASAPTWMKTLMTIDPLTYGVDALRNVVFSETVIKIGSIGRPLMKIARTVSPIRWDLSFDFAILFAVAALTGAGAAYRPQFSR